MFDVLAQIDAASSGGLYLVALQSALSVPDICGALESENGEADGKKYALWFDEWMGTEYTSTKDPSAIFGGEPLPPGLEPGPITFLDGAQAYALRCTLLHQASPAQARPTHNYPRIAFFEPGADASHRGVVWNAAPPIYTIDVQKFCADMTEAGRKWLTASATNEHLQKN